MKTFNLNRIQCGFLLVATLSLAGCGGGGGSNSSATAGLTTVESMAADAVLSGEELPQPEATGDNYLGDEDRAFSVGSAWVRYADSDLDDKGRYFYTQPEGGSVIEFDFAAYFAAFCVAQEAETIARVADLKALPGTIDASYTSSCISATRTYSESVTETFDHGSDTESVEVVFELSHDGQTLVGTRRELDDDDNDPGDTYAIRATVTIDDGMFGDPKIEYLDALGNVINNPTDLTVNDGGNPFDVVPPTTEKVAALRYWRFSEAADQADAETLQDDVNMHIRDDYDTDPTTDDVQGVSVMEVAVDGTDVSGYLFEARYSAFAMWESNTDDAFADASQYFFYGLATPENDVPTAGGATYNGFTRAAYKDDTLVGATTLTADFDNATMIGSTTLSGTGMSATVEFSDGDISGNVFSGDAMLTDVTGSFASAFTVNDAQTDNWDGCFFGPEAEEVAGTFRILNTAGDDALHGGFIAIAEEETVTQ